MQSFIEAIIGFVSANTPSPAEWAAAGPLALAWAYVCLRLAAYLKQSRGWPTGYTRKTFHFLIFGTVAFIQSVWGTRGVCLFGTMTTLVVFYAIIRGDGNPLYEAMAREKDAPHRTCYVMAPYFATLAGGLISNSLFGKAAIFGYLVTGLGDAVGAPVGTWLGRHPYGVPAWGHVKSTRSLEGSAAVFLACLLAICGGVALTPALPFVPRSTFMIPLLAMICAVLEAVSPHGWDNATLQIAPSFLAGVLL